MVAEAANPKKNHKTAKPRHGATVPKETQIQSPQPEKAGQPEDDGIRVNPE